MRQFIAHTLKRSALITVAAVSVLSFWTAGIISVAQPQVAAAPNPVPCTPSMSTDADSNIIHDGLTVNGSALNAMLATLGEYFTNNGTVAGSPHNNNNCHTDIQTVFTTNLGQTQPLSVSMIQDSGWTIGSTNHDGTIKTSTGKVVGTNTEVYSRCWIENTTTGQTNCEPSSSYQQELNQKTGNYLGVYEHAATFFTNRGNTPEPTLIHLSKDGVADFAVMIDCGNALRFTPVTPEKSLVCTSLTGQFDGDTLVRKFIGVADSQNVTFQTLTFNFGDGSTPEVDTVNFPAGHLAFTASHDYSKVQTDKDQTITATLTVNGSVTSNACNDTFHIPAKQAKQLVCSTLTPNFQNTEKTQVSFTATATTTNTSANSFSFVFDKDTNNPEVVTANTVNATTANATTKIHSFAAGDHTVTATVNGPLGTFGGCSTQFTVASQPLANTGPGDVIGLFGATTILGGAFHQFVLRRKLIA